MLRGFILLGLSHGLCSLPFRISPYFTSLPDGSIDCIPCSCVLCFTNAVDPIAKSLAESVHQLGAEASPFAVAPGGLPLVLSLAFSYVRHFVISPQGRTIRKHVPAHLLLFDHLDGHRVSLTLHVLPVFIRLVRLQDRRHEPRNRRSDHGLQVTRVDLLVPEIGPHVLKRAVMSGLFLSSRDTQHRSLGRTLFHPRPELVIPQADAAGRDREKNGFGKREDGVVLRVPLLAKRRLDLLLDCGCTVEQVDSRVCIGEPGHARVNQVCAFVVRELGQGFFGEEEDFFLFEDLVGM